MSLLASLADLSLPEILQFIDKGNKTGLLTLHITSESQAMSPSVYYLWVYEGRLVAAANRLDKHGLVKLIHQRHWVNNRVITKLARSCPSHQPLGLYLKNQGVLSDEQLKQLFDVQVLQPVGILLNIKDGFFQFDQNVPIPTREMTGLSISAGTPKLLTPPKDAKVLPRKVSKPSRPATSLAERSPHSGSSRKSSPNKPVLENELHSVLG